MSDAMILKCAYPMKNGKLCGHVPFFYHVTAFSYAFLSCEKNGHHISTERRASDAEAISDWSRIQQVLYKGHGISIP